MHVISNVINNHSSLRKSIICQINILSPLNTNSLCKQKRAKQKNSIFNYSKKLFKKWSKLKRLFKK